MDDRLFFTQATLENWIEDGEVLFEGETLTIFAQNKSYRLETAVKILSVLDGDDADQWVGNVLTSSELARADAEHYRDSVIRGETAYQCEEGFVGLGEEGEPVTEPPAELREPRTTISDDPQQKDATDSDLLADFLLKHL